LEKESQGTVRTPAGINGVSLMKKCKKYLITFGGHAQASGFRVKNENVEKFKECLIDNYDL
jgi:single-stranded DNA-specific DHH superfamily exonuclease